MSKPFKNAGWSQALYEQSSTKKETLGALRITLDGRKFRYAKAGEALAQGKLSQMLDATANHIKQVQTAYGAAVGARSINVLVGATAVTADYYADGYLSVYDGAAGAVGVQMRIISNGYSAGSAPTLCQLEDNLPVTIAATDYLSLIPNPWASVTQNASVAHGLAGIPLVPITSGYYFWCQTGGQATCLSAAGAATLGAPTIISATEGAFDKYIDQDDGGGNFDMIAAWVGFVSHFAAVDAKYIPIFLTLD